MIESSCVICEGKEGLLFRKLILNKYDVQYFRCVDCGFVHTETPYWLKEAYTEALGAEDTGLVARNIGLSSRIIPLLYLGYDPKAAYLDIAGGNGLFTRLMRDSGFNYFWSDAHATNTMARGFEREQWKGPFCAVTAFEVLEHVENPLAFVEMTLRDAGVRTMIFSTELCPSSEAPMPSWHYLACSAGQHISFLSSKSLKIMAQRLGLSLRSDGWLHLLSDKPPSDLLWRMLTTRLSRVATPFIKRRLGSRITTDHLEVTQRRYEVSELVESVKKDPLSTSFGSP